MKKLVNTKPSSRRDFLRKSALGVASAGFLGAGMSQNPDHEATTEKKDQEATAQKAAPKADITIWCPVPDLCLVRPGRFHIKKATSVSFFADKTEATLFFPDPDLTNDRVIDIPLGETRSITIKPQTIIPGEEKYYRYSVFSKTAKKFGIGNSEPELIVP